MAQTSCADLAPSADRPLTGGYVQVVFVLCAALLACSPASDDRDTALRCDGNVVAGPIVLPSTQPTGALEGGVFWNAQGQWVALGGHPVAEVWVSSDGTDWELSSSFENDHLQLETLHESDDGIVIGGSRWPDPGDPNPRQDPVLLVSRDGVRWEEREISFIGDDRPVHVVSVHQTKDRWFALLMDEQDDVQLWESEDGHRWEPRQTQEALGGLDPMVVGEIGGAVAVTGSWYSGDGVIDRPAIWLMDGDTSQVHELDRPSPRGQGRLLGIVELEGTSDVLLTGDRWDAEEDPRRRPLLMRLRAADGVGPPEQVEQITGFGGPDPLTFRLVAGGARHGADVLLFGAQSTDAGETYDGAVWRYCAADR